MKKLNVTLTIDNKAGGFRDDESMMNWINVCLNCNVNHVAVTVSKPVMPRVLVVIDGGCAYTTCDEGVDVEVFDIDNYKDSPDKTEGVPAHFSDLADQFDNVLVNEVKAAEMMMAVLDTNPVESDARKKYDQIKQAGKKPHSYSGRGMFGKECVAVSVGRHDSLRGISQKGSSIDSLGLDLIIYWSRLAWDKSFD